MDEPENIQIALEAHCRASGGNAFASSREDFRISQITGTSQVRLCQRVRAAGLTKRKSSKLPTLLDQRSTLGFLWMFVVFLAGCLSELKPGNWWRVPSRLGGSPSSWSNTDRTGDEARQVLMHDLRSARIGAFHLHSPRLCLVGPIRSSLARHRRTGSWRKS